ncbi:unnamed protein product, partial [Effrenium voratum]
QRLDSLDNRRASEHKAGEGEKRIAEIAAQVQALEHQSRMSHTAFEEHQRRQVARQRRWEQSLEELHGKVAAGEMAHSRMAARPEVRPDFEGRFRRLEQRQEFSDSALRALQAQVEEGLQAATLSMEGEHEEEASQSRASERGLMVLERKTSGQIQDLSASLATLRVRVDAQLQRMAGLAERLEAAPGLAQMRVELSASRAQDQQRCEAELAALRERLQELADGCDDTTAELREAGGVWQVPSEPKLARIELGDGIRGFFQTCQLFDVCLVVGDQRFPAHRAVLASLGGGLQQSLRRPGGELRLAAEHPEAALVLLDFAYHLGGTFQLSSEILRDVIRLGRSFGLPQLVQHVAETLALDITRENVLERLAIAVEFDLIDLYNHAFNLLLFSGQLLEVSKSPEMQRFPHLMQHMLLQLAVVRLSG